MVWACQKSRAWFRHIAGELTLAEDGKIRAAFGERIKLDPTLEIALPPAIDLSGPYATRLRSTAGGKVLDRDVEIDYERTAADRAGSILPDHRHRVRCSAGLGDGDELRFLLLNGMGKVTVLIRNQPIDTAQVFVRQAKRGFDPRIGDAVELIAIDRLTAVDGLAERDRARSAGLA